MPQVGDIAQGKDIGKANGYTRFLWASCIDCGVERWVRFDRVGASKSRCRPCAIRRQHNGLWILC